MTTHTHRPDTGQLTPDPGNPREARREDRRSFEHGTGAANADAAVEAEPAERTRDTDAPPARPAP